ASLFEDAAETYQKGLAIRSDDSRQLNAYGVVLCRLRRTAEGLVALQEAIRLQPNYEEAHFNLWLAMLEIDRLEDAVAALQKGVERRPDSALLPTTLAWVLATHPDADFRRPKDALKLATRACGLSEMRDPAALLSRAAAQAGLGHWGEAAETARTALQLAEAGGRGALADQCRKLASSYAAGRPVFFSP
ncbi:MAG: hypothetical protein O7F76_01890, partial [Planctomycetota bacterium]|nr:hypothetical protein [Planctomycetota bacterium]